MVWLYSDGINYDGMVTCYESTIDSGVRNVLI